MKNALTAIAIIAVSSSTAFAADSYTMDPAHTYASFEINHLGFSTARGGFYESAGKVALDPAAKSGMIEVTIQAKSLFTGHGKRDEHLKGDEFFNVEKFPTITFKSNKLKFNGDKLAGADGELTLLGVTKPVSLTVESFNCGNHPIAKKPVCGANAVTMIKRSDFGMKAYLPAIGDDVKLEIQAEAFKD